jgi:hypothetical protein
VRGVAPLSLTVSLAAHVMAAALVLARPIPPSAPVRSSSEELLPSPRLAGETFELPAPETEHVPTDTAEPALEGPGAHDPAREEDALPRRSPRAPIPRRPRAAAVSPETAAGATPSSGALYGAVGERGAVELASAYARAFTQTASADPAWRSAPVGPAGEGLVTITIDEQGRITHEAVEGSPGAALASSIERTLALVRGRTFVARSKVTTIRVSATVTKGTEGEDGLEDGRFGIAVTGGKASFVLPIGRRILVRVR